MPSHNLNQCWNIVNGTIGNIFQQNLKQNLCIFIQENAFENVICKMGAILSQPKLLNVLIKVSFYHSSTYCGLMMPYGILSTLVQVMACPHLVPSEVITWTKAALLLTDPLGTTFNMIWTQIQYSKSSNITCTLVCNKIVNHSDLCSWRCSNYIFILDLTSGFKGFGKDRRKAVRESFKCWDLVRLILETWG